MKIKKLFSIPTFLNLIVCLYLFSTSIFGVAFVPHNNTQLRLDIERLADHNIITIPITTWPLLWEDVYSELKNNKSKLITYPELEEHYNRVIKNYNQTKTSYSTTSVYFTDNIIYHFKNDQNREKAGMRLSHYLPGNTFSAQLGLAVTYTENSDEYKVWPNQSYIMRKIGQNWILSLDSMDRFWGPSQESSLSLSNNAHPYPAFTFQKKSQPRSNNPFFSWMGPYRFLGFIGFLEKQQPELYQITNTGLRINFKPFKDFEFGLSGIKQINAKESFSGYWKGLIQHFGVKNENETDYGSNFLYGFDFRWSFNLNQYKSVLYGDILGDDSNAVSPLEDFNIGRFDPFRHQVARTVGFKVYSSKDTYVFFEHSSTFPERLFFNPFWMNSFNFYEHGSVTSGYTYHNRSIGHTIFSNSIVDSIGYTNQKSTNSFFTVLRRYRINIHPSRQEDNFIKKENRPAQEDIEIYQWLNTFAFDQSDNLNIQAQLGFDFIIDKRESKLINSDLNEKKLYLIFGLSIHYKF